MFSFLFAASVVLITVLLVFELWQGSVLSRHKFGFNFFRTSVWDPIFEQFGALPFIYGTLVTAAIALLIAVPLGIGAAIFLAELAPARVSDTLEFFIDLLAAVPSVIYGVLGIFIVVPLMRQYVQPALKLSLGFLPLFQGPAYGDEDAEDAVNDAGDGSEKINEEFERVGDSCRGQLGKKNGGADAQGHGDQQSYRGGDERPVNERQSAELFEDGIPDRGAKEIEAELVAGENGTLPQFENKKHSNENDGRGEQKGEHAGDFIAFAQPREKRARACDGTRARFSLGCAKAMKSPACSPFCSPRPSFSLLCFLFSNCGKVPFSPATSSASISFAPRSGIPSSNSSALCLSFTGRSSPPR